LTSMHHDAMMQDMDTIRTTITLPIELHERLRIMSITQKKPLGELIAEKYSQEKPMKKHKSIKREIEEDFALFDKVARSSVPYDAARAVREERDRDNA